MPWPTFLGLNAFSYFWSQLRVYLLGNACSEPQPWPEKGSTLVLPKLPSPLLVGKRNTLELNCLGSRPGSVTF